MVDPTRRAASYGAWLLAVVACSSARGDSVAEDPSPIVDVVGCVQLFRVGTVIHADPSFRDEERAQARLATDEWFAFSSGFVDYRILFDQDPGRTFAPALVRMISSDPEVRAHDAAQRAKVIGWQDPTQARIVLVVDRFPVQDLHLVLAHEMGHLAGLYWPYCEGPYSVCGHASDATSLMSPSGNYGFGEGDRAFCIASCLCPP